MIPDNVTLIVKAPNQQIEDQNVECRSTWTVRQLKGHLSEVYPSKPRTDEQKIIYSGQLLDDNTILKDVLRTYESQIAHTMHLVCTPSRRAPEPVARPVETPSTDGLRQRNVPTQPPSEPLRAETRQNNQNHSVEMAHYLNTLAPADPALLRQAYAQYVQHMAHMWQDMAAAQAAPAPAPAPPAPPPDDAPAPDWLDQLYAASRLAILFSLVYLYGSPARLLLVLALAAAGYLHQIGFFRDLHVNAAPAPPADQPRPNPVQPNNNNQANNNQPASPDAPPPPPPTNPDTQQSLLAVTWMIFTSFFASLIPEAN